jgi:hypothetical protein
MTVRHTWLAVVAFATAAFLLASPDAIAVAPLAGSAPVAHPDTLVIPGYATSGVVDVLANDVYAAPASLGLAPSGDLVAPAHGTVALVPVVVDGVARAAVSYRPAPGFTGADAFSYLVTDASGATDEAAVTVTVTPASDRPVSFVAPASIVVLRSTTLTGSVAPAGGVLPVVALQSQSATGWSTYRTLTPAADGSLRSVWTALSPSSITWRVLATWPDGSWAVSATVSTTVVGSADPVVSGALSRRHVPYSYRSGCPVSPVSLRRLTTNFWDYTGRVRRGDVIVLASSVSAIRSVFTTAFAAKFPVKLMVPVDYYYRGGKVSAASSDILSMNAGNTSAFNCRKVTGSRYRISQHSYGNAIDVNTYENPYATSSRIYPAAAAYKYYVMRRYHLGDRGVIAPKSVIASAFARLHWLWGARWSNHDYQHFSANGG